jgi:hypothetical protein
VSRAAHRSGQVHRGVTGERRPRATDDRCRRPRSRPQARPDLVLWSRLLRSAPRPAGAGGPPNDPVGAARWLGRSAGIVVSSGWAARPTHVVPALVAFALCISAFAARNDAGGSTMATGTVRWFSDEKGFGFITSGRPVKGSVRSPTRRSSAGAIVRSRRARRFPTRRRPGRRAPRPPTSSWSERPPLAC